MYYSDFRDLVLIDPMRLAVMNGWKFKKGSIDIALTLISAYQLEL
jgi:hypothetical protein